MRRFPFYLSAVAAVAALFLLNRCCILASSAPSESPANIPADGSAVEFPVDAYALPVDLFTKIVPLNDTKTLFVLPEEPSKSVLVKLVYSLMSNSKRIDMLTYLVRQYSHYDPTSAKMLQSVRTT